ncbi:MAG TPA: chemotaxis protein CheW, partial [Methylophilaceae bacterium]|nr:chemotaxis protein CheW [Methylophilaceae bacterium]
MNALTPTAAEGASATTRQYIRFHIGEHVFALPLEALQEIIRVPPLAHVPLSPPSLKGLANNRGVVLPIIDLHHLLGVAYDSDNLSSRVLVFDLDKPVGFIVDEVSGIFTADSSQIDQDTDRAKVDNSYLAGMLQEKGRAIMLL